MSNQHTPGPWRMAEYHIVSVPLKIEIAGKLEAGDLKPYRPNSIAYATPGSPDALANARLIAAAPDLLKALITLRNDCWNKEGEIIEPTELVLDMVDELIKQFPSNDL